MRKKLLMLIAFTLTTALLLESCSAMSKMEETKTLTITTPSYQRLSDGKYRGAYDGGLVVAEVAVTIEDKRIKSVELLQHDHGRGKEAEKIVDSILEAQSLDVDVISGASVSSKAILKAAENALTP